MDAVSLSQSEEIAQRNFFSKFAVEDPNFAKGSYGKIILARDVKGKQVVIKMIPVNVATKWIYHEVEAGKRLNHPCIAKLVDQLSTNNFHYLVFDFFKGLELYELLETQEFKPVDESDVKFIFKQIFSALDHCHRNGITHRDIKLENILVNRQLKLNLVDFGLCGVNSPQEFEHSFTHPNSVLSREFVGSENYTAPEIVKRASYNPFKVDVWSCGIVLYSLLFGQFPWDDISKFVGQSSDPTQMEQPRIRFPKDIPVSDAAKQLLLQMLTVNPEARISIQEIFHTEWLLDGKPFQSQ